MVIGFPARVLEFIDDLISQDKLDFGDLILIRDNLDIIIDDLVDNDRRLDEDDWL